MVRMWFSERWRQGLGGARQSAVRGQQHDLKSGNRQDRQTVRRLLLGVLGCSYSLLILSRRKVIYLFVFPILLLLAFLTTQRWLDVEQTKQPVPYLSVTPNPNPRYFSRMSHKPDGEMTSAEMKTDSSSIRLDLQNYNDSNDKHPHTGSNTGKNTNNGSTRTHECVTEQKTEAVKLLKPVDGKKVNGDLQSTLHYPGDAHVIASDATPIRTVHHLSDSTRQQWTTRHERQVPHTRRRQQLFLKQLARDRMRYKSVYAMVDREMRRGVRHGKAVKATGGERRHVFFLKVHKAASTTVMNVLYRFALSRRLNVALPARGNVFSERGERWLSRVLPLPPSHFHFDILCNHLVFHASPIRRTLPLDAKYIGIVRKPFQQFLSAFLYYRNAFSIPYLKRISDQDPVSEYLRSPAKYEPKAYKDSFTHNRMIFDFGMEPKLMQRAEDVTGYVRYLNETFDLVMVSERFDESMVLLKRLMGWRLQDVLYIRNNVFDKKHFNTSYTPEQEAAHEKFNAADYALYEHFSRLFQARVDSEGSLFHEEVAAFVSVREKMEAFCLSRQSVTEPALTLNATSWSGAFNVSREDCLLMTMPEVPFVNLMRYRQYLMGSH